MPFLNVKDRDPLKQWLVATNRPPLIDETYVSESVWAEYLNDDIAEKNRQYYREMLWSQESEAAERGDPYDERRGG